MSGMAAEPSLHRALAEGRDAAAGAVQAVDTVLKAPAAATVAHAGYAAVTGDDAARQDGLPGVAPRPLLTIRASSRWALNLREVWRFRDLLVALAWRDVKLRYRQTALGVAWVVLQPLMAAGIFSFVFGKVANLSSEGVPYFLFSFAGLLAWNVFSGVTSKAGVCLVGNSQLVSKVYFPRMILPLSAVLSCLLDVCIALSVLVVLMAAWGVPPGRGLLLLPVWSLMIVMTATGAALFVSALTVSYRDVQYVLPVFLQCLLYASPVAYGLSAVPAPYRTLYALNPLVGPLEGFRWSLLGTGQLDFAHLAYAGAFSLAALTVGILGFSHMQKRFADVI